MIRILIAAGLAGVLLAACDSRTDKADRFPPKPPVPETAPPVVPGPVTDPSLPTPAPSSIGKAGQGDVQLPRPGTVNDHSSPAAEPGKPTAQKPDK